MLAQGLVVGWIQGRMEWGAPLLLNTSFNENESIVESPAQALDCFLRTRMDALVLGSTIVRRRYPEASPE
ncbi:MAG: carbamoyltransferase C-terminal domain-containing protein [Gammaproteobacteria bacterium]|nr:carbamoyltransferase C-terminal domain-containing protein [Gammaproteobacteria bacterium]